SDPVDLDLTSIKSFSWQVGGSTGDEGTLMVDNVACIGATAPSDANFEGSTGDSDGDGINDGVDNCPEIANSGQWDRDNDDLGNECDSDIDGDGFGVSIVVVRDLDGKDVLHCGTTV
ncbi:MAG: thrombospondin type 3 repeat-containing protein, partial [Pseudoprimorskyibacter sp.]|nr:thrombospondin type 3 repeat-containing protein [Pseudoprimorskyibacter sp.]